MSRFRLPMVASLTIALAAAGGVAATCSRSWAEDAASGAAPAAPATPSRAQLRVKEIAQAAAAYDGRLLSSSLAGGPHSLNRLIIRSKGVEVRGYPMVTVEWDDPEADKSTAWGTPKPVDGHADQTVIEIPLPSPPHWWPPFQSAYLTVATSGQPDGKDLLFAGPVQVGVFWFPALLTVLVVGLIYPGSAMASWYLTKRRYRKALAIARDGEVPVAPPGFLTALDPVEVTKNAWGRASISKLQIFVFSLIVFGLLLLCVLQTGLIANISWAVLGLLGISAAGAVGGKLTYTAKRRLSLENWAWLRRRGWLPAEGDIAPRARWSDLLVDPATKEFDPYAFQMAIFSIVVAIALLRASFSGLESFAIPDQLLVLLGMSQVVFVGGQALGKGTFVELDQKLDELRVHERKYRELATKAATPGAGGSAADAEVERQAFKACAAQAAEMFWATYGEQLGSMPKALTTVESLEPEGIRAADPVMKAA